MLVEWICAKQCFLSPQSRVSKVFPFLCGDRESSDPYKWGNLFTAETKDQSLLDALPETVPLASIETAKQQRGSLCGPGQLDGQTDRDAESFLGLLLVGACG